MRTRNDRFGLLPIALAVLTGVTAGVGGYTFRYAKGLSYFSTDPEACVNCHVMEPQYTSWQRSSHQAAAVCVDCHLPSSFVPKYLAKAENGWRHGKLFTTQGFVEPIELAPAGARILQANCERCHATLLHGLPMRERASATKKSLEGDVPCVHCHASAGHGERLGLGGPLLAGEVNRLQQRLIRERKDP